MGRRTCPNGIVGFLTCDSGITQRNSITRQDKTVNVIRQSRRLQVVACLAAATLPWSLGD